VNLSHSLLQLQAELAASVLQPKADGGGGGGGDGGGGGGGGGGACDAPLRLCPEVRVTWLGLGLGLGLELATP